MGRDSNFSHWKLTIYKHSWNGSKNGFLSRKMGKSIFKTKKNGIWMDQTVANIIGMINAKNHPTLNKKGLFWVGSVMIWAAFNANKKTPIVFIYGKIDSVQHMVIIRTHILLKLAQTIFLCLIMRLFMYRNIPKMYTMHL